MSIAAVTEWRRRQAVAQKSNDQTQISQLLPLQLAGQDTFYGAAGQSPTHVLQSARPPLRLSASQRFHTSSSVNFIGQDVMYGAPGQVEDYQLPRAWDRPKPSISQRTHTWDNINVIGQDVIYGSAGQAPSYDLPRGLDRPRRASGANTWLAHTVELIGSDQVYGAPGQAPRYDTPSARPAPRQAPSNRTWIVVRPYFPVSFCISANNDDQYEVSTTAAWTGTTPPPYNGTVDGLDHIQLEIANQQYENGFLRWDTSSIGASTIISAFLKINIALLSRPDSGQIINGEWYNWTPNPSSGDYARPPGTTAFTQAFDAMPASGIFTINLSNPAAFINPTGYTGLRLGFETSGGATAGTNFINIESLEAGTGNPACLFVTLGPAPSMYGDPGQVPNYQLPKANSRQPGAITNRTQAWTSIPFIGLDTIYGDPGQAPAYQTPNAAPRRQAPSARTWLQFGEPFLAGSDIIYAGPGQAPRYDLPRAHSPLRPNVTNRSWIQYGQPLINIDNTMYGAAGQVPSYQLPRAHSRPRWQDNRTWEYNQTLTLPIIGLFSDYIFEVVLPTYNQLVVLPSFLEQIPASQYSSYVIIPVYSFTSDLPIYYSLRRL